MAGALRITGGSLARRLIRVPAAADAGTVRPTADKVREAVMSSIAARLDGARVLDAFAGSGALGFEALSRGAVRATFWERDKKTAQVITENAAALGVSALVDVRVTDVAKALRDERSAAAYDVIFCDPPYAFELSGPLLLGLSRALAPGGTLVLERSARGTDAAPPGLVLLRERRYGDTRVVVYETAHEAQPQESAAMSTAIYPGSFDPLTNGHLDIVHRGLKMFDRVIVAVANNQQKTPLFSIDERLRQARECLGHLDRLEVDTFDGLIVEYAKRKGVGVLLRGLRAVSDFEYEFQLASMNRQLAKEVETVFMMTSEENFYLSSRLVREVASFGGNVESMVPAPVFTALTARYGQASSPSPSAPTPSKKK